MIDRRTLRKEINKFFDDEASLKDIFFYNEDVFDDNFYQNLPGTDYRTKVRSLIGELEKNKDLTDKFIKAVKEEYPDFAKEILQKEKQWQDLCEILSQINNNKLIKIAVCRAFEPIEVKSIDPNLAGFENVIDWEKFEPILKKNLLTKAEKSLERFPVIFKFACCLYQIEAEEIKTIRVDLQKWINEVAQQLNIEDYENLCQPKQSSSQENEAQSVNDYSLMITMLPTKQKKYYISAQLISEKQINSPNQEKPIDFEKDKIYGQCSFEELPEKVSQLIYAINQKYLYGQAFELTIELFLARQDLEKTIDLEEICPYFKINKSSLNIDLDLNIDKKPEIIGSKYKFILRSIERYLEGEYYNKLCTKWTLFNQNKETNNYNLKNLDKSFNKNDFILKLDNHNSLSICCSLANQKLEIKDFLDIVLRTGIPVLFWTRCNNLTEIDPENKFEKMLEEHCLEQLNQRLINDILYLRRKAHAKTTLEETQKCLGYYLGILCDYSDPLKIPKVIQSLVEPGV